MVSYSAIATSEVSYSTTEGFESRYLIAEGSNAKHSTLVAYKVCFTPIEAFDDLFLKIGAVRQSSLHLSSKARYSERIENYDASYLSVEDSKSLQGQQHHSKGL